MRESGNTNIFKSMFEQMPKNGISMNSKVFDWISIDYSSDMIIDKMIYIVLYDMDNQLIEELISFKDLLSPNSRRNILSFFTSDKSDKIQRSFVFECLSDKSMAIREEALSIASELELTIEETKSIEGLLKLKTGSIRQNTIKLLLSLNEQAVEESVERLINSKSELQRLGALEIIAEIKKNKQLSSTYRTLEAKISSIEQPTEKEKVLIEKLSEKEEESPSDCYGLLKKRC